MKLWFTIPQLVGLPGLGGTPQGVIKKARREKWISRPRETGKGHEYHLDSLPEVTRVALILERAKLPDSTTPGTPPAVENRPVHPVDAAPAAPPLAPGAAPIQYEAEDLWRRFGAKSDAQQQRAHRRAAALNAALTLADRGVPKRRAFEQAAAAHNMHVSSLYRAYEKVLPYHPSDWAAALVGGYTGGTPRSECSVEAWDYFKSDYLRNEAPAATAVYARLKRAANEHSWTVPSLATLTRRLRNELSRAAIILARRGPEALKRSYPAQERDRSVFNALEAVCADGHTFDVFVKWPDGQIVRPVMLGWQDIFSGKLLSWRVDQTENTDAVRLSFGDLVEQYGIPSAAYLDNGRAFASKWMTGGIPNRYRFKVKEAEPVGILTLMGIDVRWVTPYHGQAKPIERAWRDLCETIAKHPSFSGAYTGNSPSAKPENYASHAVPLKQFLSVVEQEITAHNARDGRRSAVCSGRSFDAVFAESYEKSPIRKATAEQRRLWLLAAEAINVRADGTITLGVDRRNRYWDDVLHNHAGKSVVVRFDPQSLHTRVYVYTLDGRYLCEAACVDAAGYDDSIAARDHNRARNQFKRAARAQLDAARRMDAHDAARFLPNIESPDAHDARIVRPVRPVTELRPLPVSTLSQSERDDLQKYQDNIRALPERKSLIEQWQHMTESQRMSAFMGLHRRACGGEKLQGEEQQIYEVFGASDTAQKLLEVERDLGIG